MTTTLLSIAPLGVPNSLLLPQTALALPNGVSPTFQVDCDSGGRPSPNGGVLLQLGNTGGNAITAVTVNWSADGTTFNPDTAGAGIILGTLGPAGTGFASYSPPAAARFVQFVFTVGAGTTTLAISGRLT